VSANRLGLTPPFPDGSPTTSDPEGSVAGDRAPDAGGVAAHNVGFRTWCFFDVPASNVLVADFPEPLDPARRQYRLARPVVPRAEVDELSPAGVRLLEPTRASTGFPDQANKFPDVPI
jgi:hypothetical protein